MQESGWILLVLDTVNEWKEERETVACWLMIAAHLQMRKCVMSIFRLVQNSMLIMAALSSGPLNSELQTFSRSYPSLFCHLSLISGLWSLCIPVFINIHIYISLSLAFSSLTSPSACKSAVARHLGRLPAETARRDRALLFVRERERQESKTRGLAET